MGVDGTTLGATADDLDDAVAALERDGHVRADVPGGWLQVDRPLPFLCVHRRSSPADGGERLVWGQACHLVTSGDPATIDQVRRWLRAVVSALEERGDFGAFLLVEAWFGGAGRSRVVAPEGGAASATALARALRRADRERPPDLVEADHCGPPALPPLLPSEDARLLGVVPLGLELAPSHLDGPDTIVPVELRRLEATVTVALRQAAFEFATVETTLQPEHVGLLAPRRLREPTRRIDRRLAELAEVTDPLLAVTPVDADAAWTAFVEGGYRSAPPLHYRPLTVDPDLVRRDLYDLRVEEVEDPSLAALFREKRHELDAELDLLVRRDADGFLAASTVLYGSVDRDLLDAARDVLDRLDATPAAVTSPAVDAETFAARARAEVDGLRRVAPDLALDVEIRDDVSGLMVHHGRLLVDARLSLHPRRVDALLQHEIGTHVVTWHNGGHQPLRLLQVGLPRYEETQEALALVAEYVAGGLTAGRLVTLAGRVLAVASVVDGGSFVETFRLVVDEVGLAERPAFDVTLRVHRGGGFTKDAVYLRGLRRLLAHLGAGASLDDLLVGKLSVDHLPLVEDLRGRGVLAPGPLEPSWLRWPGGEDRLDSLRTGLDLGDLVAGASS